MVDLVLTTDMSVHFDILSQFKTKVSSGTFMKTNSDDRLLLMKIALKIADLSNASKPSNIYLQWCDRVNEEFWVQGDKERSLGLPISPFMDRNNPMVAKSQQVNIIFLWTDRVLRASSAMWLNLLSKLIPNSWERL